MEKGIDIGRAYGFFGCDASRRKIEAELPKIRRLVKTPSQLEFSLAESAGSLGDERLDNIAQGAERDGSNYTLQAAYSDGSSEGAANEGAANEVSDVLNQLSLLDPYNDGFYGDRIVYEQNGQYVER